ncbi:MAG TPA: 2-oxoacid:ferredoxin oxidoreductase subunit beta, partial [Ottowia sp.]|nr:2-oxoacid:ferredoxin oxidoreductase subunit beta [Ottowia sp.]
VVDVEQHDGTILRLRKLHTDYDPTDRVAAMAYMQAHAAQGELVTGLLYLEGEAGDLHAAQHTSARPLNSLDTADLCPGAAALERLNAGWR